MCAEASSGPIRCDAPARCGALADERRIVDGDEGGAQSTGGGKRVVDDGLWRTRFRRSSDRQRRKVAAFDPVREWTGPERIGAGAIAGGFVLAEGQEDRLSVIVQQSERAYRAAHQSGIMARRFDTIPARPRVFSEIWLGRSRDGDAFARARPARWRPAEASCASLALGSGSFWCAVLVSPFLYGAYRFRHMQALRKG